MISLVRHTRSGLLPLLALSAVACGSGPHAPTQQERALEAAKRCAKSEEYSGKGIHGSPLVLERGRIRESNDTGDVVYFPEKEPRGSPMGLTLHVDAQSGECTRLPI
jgi:hypothetical protein